LMAPEAVVEEAITQVPADLKNKTDETACQLLTLSPLRFDKAPLGTRTHTFVLGDRVVVTTIEISPKTGQTLEKRVQRVDRVEATVAELEGHLERSQHALSSLNRRLTNLELQLEK